MEENKIVATENVRIEQFLDSVDHLSEPVKNIYSKDEETGRYKLDDTVHSAISGTRNTLSKVRTERDSFKSKLDDLNSQLDSFKSKKDEPVVAKTKETQPNDQIDVLKRQIEDLKKVNEEKDRASQKSAASSVISSAISKHGAVPEATSDILRSKVKTVYENGEYVARVVDSAGNVRYGNDGDAPMTIDELMLEMKSSDGYRPLFMSNKVTGAGVRPSSSNALPSKDKKRADMTMEERMQDTLRKRGLI